MWLSYFVGCDTPSGTASTRFLRFKDELRKKSADESKVSKCEGQSVPDWLLLNTELIKILMKNRPNRAVTSFLKSTIDLTR